MLLERKEIATQLNFMSADNHGWHFILYILEKKPI